MSSDQPLLPRVGMKWYFVLAAAIAVVLAIVRASGQGRAVQVAIVLTGLMLVLFGIFSALSFLLAYAMGAAERATLDQNQSPASPFSYGSLPPQIIPPQPTDGNG